MATGPKGEKHLCAGCGKWHEAHRPDNCSAVPVCKDCWQKASINTKLFAISMARNSRVIEDLDRTIYEGIDAAILRLVDARLKEMGRHSDN